MNSKYEPWLFIHPFIHSFIHSFIELSLKRDTHNIKIVKEILVKDKNYLQSRLADIDCSASSEQGALLVEAV